LAWIHSGVRPLKSHRWNSLRHLLSPFGVPAENLAERLGYDRKARLLIVHADDLGLTKSVNAAFISGFATGRINSGSAMAPCPWFSEIASFARAHPHADIGLHFTLTSERAKDLFAPISPPAKIRSLIDKNGYFLQEWTQETRIDADEVEIELLAQMEKAYAEGLHPTHLDSHQFRLQMGRGDLFAVYLRLARAYRLPVLIAREWLVRYPYLQRSLRRRDVVLDRVATINAKVAPQEWPDFYRRTLEKLPSGISELLIHPGYDNDELRAFFADRQDWGAAWRQRDSDFFASDAFGSLLLKYDIKLITWREIASRLP
jgi:predicted glycoside hydrolase/deacetylase ChbG (UPF0249 family)